MVKVKRFTAIWCGPCRQLAPIFEQLQIRLSELATFNTIDVDTSPEEVQKYNVTSVPTVIIEKDGEVIERFTGLSSKIAYVNAINESLK